LAVVEWLNNAVVTLSVGKGSVASKERVDGVELLLVDAKRVLHHEPLHALSARRRSDRALVVIVFTTESLAELVEIHRGVDGSASERGLGDIGPVDRVEEGVGEATIRLDVEQDSNHEQVVEASGSLLLVNDVEFHLLVAILGWGGVEGVLRGSVELDLLHIVLLTIARVAATNGHIAEITLDLESIARVLESEVGDGDVMVVNAVVLSIVLTVAHADSGLGVDVDGRLLSTSRASTSPITATLGISPGRGRSCWSCWWNITTRWGKGTLLGRGHSKHESKCNNDTHSD